MSNQIATIEDMIFGAMQEANTVCSFNNPSRLEAEKNFATQLLYANSFAADTARKNPVSVYNAIINLSAIGISLNPATKHAYLVPRDGAICLDISYMGLMHLAQEIGSILFGQAKIVYANDTYENQGLTKEPIHKFNAFGDRGEPVGVYCSVKLPHGDFLTEEMDKVAVYDIRSRSKAFTSGKKCPWVTDELEMWRKTVVKRASKYWPKSSDRLDKAVHVINQHEGLQEDDTYSKATQKLIGNYEEWTPIELWSYFDRCRSLDEDLYIHLYNQFPAGQKVSGKKKVNDGGKLISDYIAIFKEGSESEIEEATEELTESEFKIVNAVMEKRR